MRRHGARPAGCPIDRPFPRRIEGKTFQGIAAGSGPLRGRRWSGTRFFRCDFSGRDLRGSEFRRCSFTECGFSGARLAGSSVLGAAFTRCDLRETDWRESVLRDLVLEDCDTQRATFALAVFEEVRLRGTSLGPAQTPRSFGSFGPASAGGGRAKRRGGSRRLALSLIGIACALLLAAVLLRLDRDPTKWGRQTVLEQIDRARGKGDLRRALGIAERAAAGQATDPVLGSLRRDLRVEMVLAGMDEKGEAKSAGDRTDALLLEPDLEPRVRLELLLRRAEALVAAGDPERARALLVEAGDRVPAGAETFGVRKRLADLLSGLGNLEAAEAVLRDLVHAPGLGETQRRDAQLHLANVLRTRGLVSEAEAIYRDLVKHGSDPGQIAHGLESLALLAGLRGDPEAAEALYREIPGRLPGLAWAAEMSWWGLADLFERTDRPREALDSLGNILAVSKDPSRISWSLWKRFVIAERLGDAALADAAYRRLQKEYRDSEPAGLARQVRAERGKARPDPR